MKNVIDELQKRAFIEAMTAEDLRDKVNQPIRVYCGFDPTSDSLHLGNLVAIMGLAWFRRLGHTVVVLVGGATGMIGDPSGKSQERNLLDEETLQKNVLGIEENIRRVFSRTGGSTEPIILNNYEWFKEFSYLAFLRDVGKQSRLGPMLAKESVKTRMTSEEGMSYTEFSYQLLQGYDFLYLLDHHGVSLQMGGSDQWGNITAGTDLIRKMRGVTAHGLTFPLLVRSDGKKFGKSEKGAIWLSTDKTSPYQFYQYLVRIPDADVLRLMGMLTLLDVEKIAAWQRKMQEPDYLPNSAQICLAEEVTRLVHGEEGLAAARKATEAAAPGSSTVLDEEQLEAIQKDIPHYTMKGRGVLGCKIVDLLVEEGVQKSKGDVRRLIRNGGLYLNNQKIEDDCRSITEEDLIGGRFLLFALGKKNKILLSLSQRSGFSAQRMGRKGLS